jgi:hypothetical protein
MVIPQITCHSERSEESVFYLTPCVPLSLKGEGEEIRRRVFTLLKLPFSYRMCWLSSAATMMAETFSVFGIFSQ